MRLYEGKIIDRGLNRRFRKRAETRDAVLWDLDDTNKLARCKVQGSNEFILCHYPRNWQTLPPWCRRGNAVRIAHKGGVRGYYEIIGHGRAVPTPVSGSQFPAAETLYDGILSGGAVYPYGGMSVKVDSTTYRISGDTYSLTPDSMDVPITAGIDGILEYEGLRSVGVDAILEHEGLRSAGVDAILVKETHVAAGVDALLQQSGNTQAVGIDALLQSIHASVTLDAAPTAPQSRYDLLAAGTDSAVDVVKGTAGTDPVMPATPAGHVKLGHVLVLGGLTAVTIAEINALFEPRHLSEIAWSLASGTGTINVDEEFVYNALPGTQTPYCQVTVALKDQYGWSFDDYWQLTIDFLYGTGGISLSASGTYAQDSLNKTITSGSSATFYYQRDQTASETSPVIQLSIANESFQSARRIQLLNSVGGEIA